MILFGSVCVLVGSAGCGGADPERPGGYERFEAERVSFVYPANFEADKQGGIEGSELLNVRGPENDDGLFLRVTLIETSRGMNTTAKRFGVIVSSRRAFDLNQGRVLDAGEAKVRGAAGNGDAYRVVTRFIVDTEDGKKVPAQLEEVVAFGAGDKAYILSVAGPVQMLEDIDKDRVLDSFRVHPQ